jgi:hypothetical protein
MREILATTDPTRLSPLHCLCFGRHCKSETTFDSEADDQTAGTFVNSMAKAVAPIPDHKVQCHCGFDTFVTRVDQRAKHSSGLAIHESLSTPVREAAAPSRRFAKSTFYRETERAFKDRNKPDPAVLRRISGRTEVGKKFVNRMRAEQQKMTKKKYTICLQLGVVEVPPDLVCIAQFGYHSLVRLTPDELFGIY